MIPTTSTKRNLQRRANKKLRKINNSLANDELWKGRFYVHQFSSEYHTYPDKSGSYLVIELLLIDKKTKHTSRIWIDNSENQFFDFDLWKEVNYFIVNDCKVWDENPRPNRSGPSYVDTPIDFLENL